jgi:hypothetical protein
VACAGWSQRCSWLSGKQVQNWIRLITALQRMGRLVFPARNASPPCRLVLLTGVSKLLHCRLHVYHPILAGWYGLYVSCNVSSPTRSLPTGQSSPLLLASTILRMHGLVWLTCVLFPPYMLSQPACPIQRLVHNTNFPKTVTTSSLQAAGTGPRLVPTPHRPLRHTLIRQARHGTWSLLSHQGHSCLPCAGGPCAR